MSEPYTQAQAQRLLSEADGVAEQGIDVIPEHGRILLRGQVETEARRAAVEARVRAIAGGTPVHNEITVAGHGAPDGHEEVS